MLAVAEPVPLGVWVVIIGGAVLAWAASNQLSVVDLTLIPRFRGPFRMRGYWTSVFRVRVWVCTGNFFVWAFTEPDVRWDQDPAR